MNLWTPEPVSFFRHFSGVGFFHTFSLAEFWLILLVFIVKFCPVAHVQGEKWKKLPFLNKWFPTFLAQGTSLLEDSFSMDLLEVWFWDDSSALRLLCSLFLLLFYQLHLRPSGIRSWRLGTPDLNSIFGLNDGNLGMTEDEMIGWHHWLNGHEFEQTPGDGEGQEILACCLPLDCKELDTDEWLENKIFKSPSIDWGGKESVVMYTESHMSYKMNGLQVWLWISPKWNLSSFVVKRWIVSQGGFGMCFLPSMWQSCKLISIKNMLVTGKFYLLFYGKVALNFLYKPGIAFSSFYSTHVFGVRI